MKYFYYTIDIDNNEFLWKFKPNLDISGHFYYEDISYEPVEVNGLSETLGIPKEKGLYKVEYSYEFIHNIPYVLKSIKEIDETENP